MKLYEFEGFPNPARIRFALAEKGLMDQVEFVSVDVPKGEHREESYLKKNPSGTVPALELEDGTVISECTAITEYLDNLKDPGYLTGSTAKRRAVIHMMQRRAESGLMDAVGAYFHHATDGLGPELETVQIKEWGENQRENALKSMRYFDGLLSKQDFVVEDGFSMADITLFSALGFADFAQIDIPEDCTNLKTWRERVASRPSIAA